MGSTYCASRSKLLKDDEKSNLYCYDCSHCKKCKSEGHMYDGLCYDCSHCQSCKQYTKELQDGLCTSNQHRVELRAYRKDIVALDVVQNGNFGKISIRFRRSISAKEKVLEKSELKKAGGIFGMFKKDENPDLVSSFKVTRTHLINGTAVYQPLFTFWSTSFIGRSFVILNPG